MLSYSDPMSKYRLEDGKVLNTDKASAEWEEAIDWNGQNFVSRPTRSQWEHETLYRSSKGRYYIERTSQRPESRPYAVLVTNEQATAWLLANDHELPQELVGP
jgi:hypothetical protein